MHHPRMHDTAAHLVDRVIPHVPVRQWVLSLPRWARFLLARDPLLITRTLEIALRAIFAHQRRRARRAGALAPRVGAVTFVQRFGGALNLNVHFHCAIPDGVFVRQNSSVRFVELAPPSDDDVMAVLRRAVARLERLLRPRLMAAQADARPMDELGAVQAEAMHVLGTSPLDTGRAKKRAAYLQGFSLHAAVHLHANDREGLAHLCGYGARPPFSQERLSELPDGRLAYRLKRPLGDGRQVLLLQPTELLRRLATLVPPPRAHLVRYHGVFAPASRWRSQVIPPLPEKTPLSSAPSCASTPARPKDTAPAVTETLAPDRPPAEAHRPADPSHIPWAELLMRVFREDVLACPCGGRRVVLAYLTQPGPVKAILDHLGLPSTDPPIAPARSSEGLAEATWQDDVPELQQSLR
jgi:putative transposase